MKPRREAVHELEIHGAQSIQPNGATAKHASEPAQGKFCPLCATSDRSSGSRRPRARIMTVMSDAGSRPVPTSTRSMRPPTLLQRMGTLRISPAAAVPLSIGGTLIAAVGDAVTTADATFTLFYLVPLSLAVWYASLRLGYLIICLIIASSLGLDVFYATHRIKWIFIAWNTAMEAGLFILFAHVLSTLRDRMNEEVNLRTGAIDQLRHAERLTTIGKLASGVAHELGTPLNVISGRASLIIASKVADTDTRNSAAIIVEQVERSVGIIRHLLDFARRGGSHREALNLSAVCRETVDLVTPFARKAGVEIELQGPAVSASCNRGEVQQVLSNLLTNAIQAMPKGGRITVTTRLATTMPPDSKSEPPRTFAAFTVRDTGTGIPLDILPQIFDPFFTTKDVGLGTGLGLSVSYGIIRDHGGWISVDTRLGEGTSFTVYLPT